MKLFCWLITVAVFVSGVVAGRLDFDAERTATTPTGDRGGADPGDAGSDASGDPEEDDGPPPVEQPQPKQGGEPRVHPLMDADEELKVLAAARALVKEAREIYQRAVIEHTSEPLTLHFAKEKLEKAGAMLSKLPRDDAPVAKLREDTQYLLAAVIKSLPL